MKKFCLLLILMSLLWVRQASAQSRGEVMFIMGMPAEMTSIDYEYSYDASAWDLYSSYEPRFIKDSFGPTLGLHYQQFVTDKIKVGGAITWFSTSDKYYEPVSNEYTAVRNSHSFALLAQARYCYVERPYWHLYSGVGLGGKLTASFTTGEPTNLKPGLAYEAILLGVRSTLVLPFFVELVYGNTTVATRFGIGFTF